MVERCGLAFIRASDLQCGKWCLILMVRQGWKINNKKILKEHVCVNVKWVSSLYWGAKCTGCVSLTRHSPWSVRHSPSMGLRVPTPAVGGAVSFLQVPCLECQEFKLQPSILYLLRHRCSGLAKNIWPLEQQKALICVCVSLLCACVCEEKVV